MNRICRECGFEFDISFLGRPYIYPHLKGRVDRARTLAGKLELDYRTERLAIEYKPDNLAEKALEEI